jgi:hypothetical protein
MKAVSTPRRPFPAISSLILLVLVSFAHGDVILADNGERFVGTIIAETSENVVFQSEIGGKVTISRIHIREIQRTQSPATRRASTRPPLPEGVGTDGSDWLELKSGEWLKGRLKYVQKRTVELDSEKLDRQKFELKDVQRLYPAQPMYTKFEGLPTVLAPVRIENELVSVEGDPGLQLPRDQLTGITPGGQRERDYWSGEFTLSLNLESGNTRQANLSTNLSLARRTPNTRLDLEYLANYSVVDNAESARDQRLTCNYDILLDDHFFVRAASLEYYHDPLANIDHRLTGAVALGYAIFDRNDLEWFVAAGPAFQKTWFVDVPPGENDTTTSPGAVLQSNFKKELTKDVDLILKYGAIFTTPESGTYSHHAETTLKFDITKAFNLNVSFVWDRIQNPQREGDGAVPNKDDYRLNVGVGWKF